MSRLRPVLPASRSEARRGLRDAVERLGRPLRVLAEDILGLDRSLDLVCADPAGRVVVVLLGRAGEDLELVADGLAQRAWLEPRLGDWRKLAPGLDVRPDLGVGALLVAPDFGARAREAARDATGIGLARIRFVAASDPLAAEDPPPAALLELLDPPDPSAGGVEPGADLPGAGGRGPAPPRRRSAFRTGLSEAELRPARRSEGEG